MFHCAQWRRWTSGNYTAFILNVDIKYETHGWLDAPTAFPRGKVLRYLLNSRLRGYQNRRPEKFLSPAENRLAFSLFTVPIGLLILNLFQNIVFCVGRRAFSPVRLLGESCMLLQWTWFPDRSSFEQLAEMSGRHLQFCTNPRFCCWYRSTSNDGIVREKLRTEYRNTDRTNASRV